VFHVPFATSAAPRRPGRPLAARACAARQRAINLARGKRWSDPLIPTHIYNMDAVLRKVDESGAPAAHVVFQQQRGLSNAFVFAEVRCHRLPASTNEAVRFQEPRSASGS